MTLANHKAFAIKITKQLLCAWKKPVQKPFIDRIENASNSNEISRIMVDVRRAI